MPCCERVYFYLFPDLGNMAKQPYLQPTLTVNKNFFLTPPTVSAKFEKKIKINLVY